MRKVPKIKEISKSDEIIFALFPKIKNGVKFVFNWLQSFPKST